MFQDEQDLILQSWFHHVNPLKQTSGNKYC